MNTQPNQPNQPNSQQAPKPAAFSEAPASWNCKYLLNGFECMITLRGETGGDVLNKAAAAIKWLTDNGAEPTRPTSNGNGNHQAAQPEPTRSAICEIHDCEMRRHEKDGQVWYSHKLASGQYCKGV